MNILANLYLANPEWLFAIPLALLALIFVTVKTNKPLPSLVNWLNNFSREVYRHPLAASLLPDSGTTKSKRVAYRFFSILSYTILISLFAMSLAHPYKVGKKLPDPPQHRDIVFLVDTSVSMVLRDYLVNGERTQRITVLKNVLSHFIEQLKGNRIQLIAYSERAYTLVPLTTDYSLLNYQLQRLDPATLTGRSSDMSNAILYALQNYQQSTRTTDINTTVKTTDENQPVFVMLTDANRPIRTIDPRIAAEYLAQYGIRLHTVAIGAGSYEAEDQEHQSLIYHPTRFNLLQEVANAAEGQFFWAKDSASLASALRSINEGEKRRGFAEAQHIKQPLYFWTLFAALGWLIVSYLFSLIPWMDGLRRPSR